MLPWLVVLGALLGSCRNRLPVLLELKPGTPAFQTQQSYCWRMH